jgi:hypothetical protein
MLHHSDSQNMGIINVMQAHFASNKVTSVSNGTIQMIFHIFNNREVKVELKRALMRMMCSNGPFRQVREDIRKLLLHQLNTKQLHQEDQYAIYVSQYILA